MEPVVDYYIELPKSKIITIERIFSRGEREIITTENGHIEVLNNEEVFAVKVNETYITYHILPSGEVQRANITYKLKSNG